MIPIPVRMAVALLIVLGLTLTASAADPPSKEQIAAWVKQLASDDFEEREAASKALWKAGKVAEAALRQVLKSDDAEAVRRARDIVDKFDWGIYPDTPEPIVALIREYRSATPENRADVVKKLLDHGWPGYAALRTIAEHAKEPQTRQLIWDVLTAEMPRFTATLLERGEEARLEEVLEQALTGDWELRYTNYAAYLLVRGTLDDRLRDLRKKAGDNPDKKIALTLAYLCRANGDLAGARKYAEKAEQPALLRTILIEQEDWKGLLDLMDHCVVGVEAVSSRTGLRLACWRLLGDRDRFEKNLSREIDTEKAASTLGLFVLNGRIDEGMAWLTKHDDDLTAAELLAARQRFRPALERADQCKVSTMRPGLFQVRQLWQLGERKKAREILDRLIVEITQKDLRRWVPYIVREELSGGYKDEAFARAAELLADEDFTGVLTELFPPEDNFVSVEPWWLFLRRKYPADDNAATLKRMRGLFDGKVPSKQLAEWLSELADEAAPLKPDERERRLRRATDTCRRLGRDDLTAIYLEKRAAFGNVNAMIELGDLAAEGKRWKEAAGRYKRAWEMDRGNALALYLHGHALAQSGQQKDGRRWMDAAQLLPLGNTYRRIDLTGGLIERGLEDAGGREWERLGRLILFDAEFDGVTARGMAERAAAAGDHARAAVCARREVLFCLMQHLVDDPEDHLSHLAFEHRCRARALVAAGKLDELRKEIDAALAVRPELDLAIDLVPELNRLRHKKEADDLFRRVSAAYDVLCKEHPQSAWAHDQAAWLAVRCRRDLETAQEHGRRATELSPETPRYWETLAEVHFQRGEKDKAVELMKKCVEMERTNAYFRNQLKRMQAGDKDAPLPRNIDKGTWTLRRFRDLIPR